MTPRMDYSIPPQRHFVNGGASPQNEVRVVGECGTYHLYHLSQVKPDYQDMKHKSTICEIIYVNSEIYRIGMFYLTSHYSHHITYDGHVENIL